MLIESTPPEPLNDNSPCPVNGKYKNCPMKDVPSHFLDWFRGQPHLMKKYPNVADYIARTAKSIDQDLEDDDEEESWGKEFD